MKENKQIGREGRGVVAWESVRLWLDVVRHAMRTLTFLVFVWPFIKLLNHVFFGSGMRCVWMWHFGDILRFVPWNVCSSLIW